MNFPTFRWELEKTLIPVADKVFQRSLKVYLSGGHFVGVSARKHGDIVLQLNISTREELRLSVVYTYAPDRRVGFRIQSEC